MRGYNHSKNWAIARAGFVDKVFDLVDNSSFPQHTDLLIVKIVRSYNL